MPVYDAEIDYTENDKVIIVTVWGVWTCDNAFSATSGSTIQWTDESKSPMVHVPVFFAVEQQDVASWEAVSSGALYIGTHGRGFYKSTDLPGIGVSVEENEFVTDLNVYPNPINNSGTLAFILNKHDESTIKIYNLTGSLVKKIELGVKTQGELTINFDASSLSIGSYIISLESGSERKKSKFIIVR